MDKNSRQYESVFTKKVKAGRRRTYFMDVRQTKGDDYYITLTESTKKLNGDGYERHKIFLYKEDFNRFLSSLTETIDHIKTELLPDYDFDEFTRRNQEWENQKNEKSKSNPEVEEADSEVETPVEEEESNQPDVESEEDMEW